MQRAHSNIFQSTCHLRLFSNFYTPICISNWHNHVSMDTVKKLGLLWRAATITLTHFSPILIFCTYCIYFILYVKYLVIVFAVIILFYNRKMCTLHQVILIKLDVADRTTTNNYCYRNSIHILAHFGLSLPRHAVTSVTILVFGLLLLPSFYSVVLSETSFKSWSLTSCSDVVIHRRL